MTSVIAIANPLGTASHRLGLTSVVLSTCAINVLSLALPIATLQIYDRVLHGQNSSTLHALVLVVVMALGLELLLRLIRSYIVCQRGAAYAHGLSCAAMTVKLDSRTAPDENQAIAADLAGLSAIKSIKDFHSGYSLIVFIDLLFLPLFIGLMAYISQALVLVPLALLCAFGIVTALSGLKIRSRLQQAEVSEEKRNDYLIDSLMSIKFTKSLALEKLLQRRFERLHTASCESRYWLSRSITESVVHSTALGHVMTAATVAVGAYLAVQDQLSVGVLVAVVQLSSRLMQPVQKAVLLWTRYQDYQAARARVERLFDHAPPATVEMPALLKNTGRLQVDQITYRPGDNLPLLLDGVNFSLERGQSVILDGQAGCGKSTLLKIIAGIYAPTSGVVRINGGDVAQIPSAELSRHVGYLTPRTTVLRGTIRDNITRFNEVPIGQALALSRFLGLKAEFDRLPMGIDTIVGPGSEAGLSPGLSQMISVMRILSSKPRIILFDDADNGLDLTYYNSLFSLLGKIKPNVAMIVVSQDLNFRRLADRRFTLVDGRLVEAEMNSYRPLPTIPRK